MRVPVGIKFAGAALLALSLVFPAVAAEKVSVEVDVVEARVTAKASMDRRIPRRLAKVLQKERSYNSFTLIHRNRASTPVGRKVNFPVAGDIYIEVEPVTKRTSRRPHTTLKTSLYRRVKSGRKHISKVSVSVPKDKPFLQTLEREKGTLYMALFAD